MAARPPERRPSWPTRAAQAALDGSTPLASLLARLRDSERRWAAVAPLLPSELAAVTRAGPLGDDTWTLLADHAAAAAKLRQCLPSIERALSEAGWITPPIKIKVRPRA